MRLLLELLLDVARLLVWKFGAECHEKAAEAAANIQEADLVRASLKHTAEFEASEILLDGIALPFRSSGTTPGYLSVRNKRAEQLNQTQAMQEAFHSHPCKMLHHKDPS